MPAAENRSYERTKKSVVLTDQRNQEAARHYLVSCLSAFRPPLQGRVSVLVINIDMHEAISALLFRLAILIHEGLVAPMGGTSCGLNDSHRQRQSGMQSVDLTYKI
jgi:hypothetical protein